MNHGDHDNCGRVYEVRGGAAYCPACGTGMSGHVDNYPLGTSVRLSRKFIKNMGLDTVVRSRFKGMVVGATENRRWVIVEWDDGYVSPVLPANIEVVKGGAR
jgi:hypothetical protein